MSTNRESIAKQLAGVHVYGLARRADVFDPDGTDTPGARWLELVRDSAIEQLDCVSDDELTADGIRDAMERGNHESADALVPVYTAERWAIFTDLGAWTVDVSDFGPVEDVTEAAGLALYETARVLLDKLTEDVAEILEEGADTDE